MAAAAAAHRCWLACPALPQAGGLYWVASTRENVSPSLVVELLLRIHSICCDYFGYVSEEVRRPARPAAKLAGCCWACCIGWRHARTAMRWNGRGARRAIVGMLGFVVPPASCRPRSSSRRRCLPPPPPPPQVVRKNFLLVYELLDEVADYGFPQNSSTERLRQFVLMEPLAVKSRAPVSGRDGQPGGSAWAAAWMRGGVGCAAGGSQALGRQDALAGAGLENMQLPHQCFARQSPLLHPPPPCAPVRGRAAGRA
jgi:hypothetical protein